VVNGNILDALTYIGIAAIGWIGSTIRSQITQKRKADKLENDVVNLAKDKNAIATNIKELADEFRERLDKQDVILQDLQLKLEGLRITVIGIDGQNGIRGDVKELKEAIKK